MKLLNVVLIMNGGLLLSQSSSGPAQSAGSSSDAPTALQAAVQRAPHTPIPKHVVYAHFLSMVNDFDNKATAANDPDPYKFAQPFSRARLENADLDVLREHAKAFTSDLQAHDQRQRY